MQYLILPVLAPLFYQVGLEVADKSVLQRDRNKKVMDSLQAWTQNWLQVCKDDPYIGRISPL